MKFVERWSEVCSVINLILLFFTNHHHMSLISGPSIHRDPPAPQPPPRPLPRWMPPIAAASRRQSRLCAPRRFPPRPPWKPEEDMAFSGPGSAALLLGALAVLLGRSSAGSDAPRGVAFGFVFDPKATCEPPCEHAGICIRNNTCFCSRGYEGETCKYANCYPKCKNGGRCLRPGKCRCPPGYGGRYCHKVTCEGGCWNGGECTAVNGVAKCICPSSWAGSKCQEAICPQGCRNGGVCVAPGICSCPEGWLGGACHTAVCTQPCLNGGKCISPDKCRCRPPFSGPRCEERKKLH